MGKEIKFTEEELQKLKGLQEGYLKTQSKFGQLAIAKLTLDKQADEINDAEEETNSEFGKLQETEKDLVDSLTEKYGEGTLDPKSGVFTPTKNQ
jgi:hypothetical protein